MTEYICDKGSIKHDQAPRNTKWQRKNEFVFWSWDSTL